MAYERRTVLIFWPLRATIAHARTFGGTMLEFSDGVSVSNTGHVVLAAYTTSIDFGGVPLTGPAGGDILLAALSQ